MTGNWTQTSLRRVSIGTCNRKIPGLSWFQGFLVHRINDFCVLSRHFSYTNLHLYVSSLESAKITEATLVFYHQSAALPAVQEKASPFLTGYDWVKCLSWINHQAPCNDKFPLLIFQPRVTPRSGFGSKC